MRTKNSSLRRRDLLKTALGAPLAASLAACASSPEPLGESKRPNILFCFADDQSWPHSGALGDAIVQTPAFDRVAREGVLFNHSFCTSPSCAPSRSSVLTGRHIWQVEEGGVLYEEYIQAEDAAENENWPGSYAGVIPVVQGEFSEKRIDGLHIYIPPKYEEVHTGHLRGREEDDGITNEEEA